MMMRAFLNFSGNDDEVCSADVKKLDILKEAFMGRKALFFAGGYGFLINHAFY
jgi:hypothetical protein